MNKENMNKSTSHTVVNVSLLKRIKSGNYTVRRGMPVAGQRMNEK